MTEAQDIWAVLGTERTRDMLQIRRAYARKLKITNPEDDAEAFERLRAAFERAMAFANQAVWTEDLARLMREKAANSEVFEEGRTPPRPSSEPKPGPESASASEPASPAEAPSAAEPGSKSDLERLQNEFQALDLGVTKATDLDRPRLSALFARCLESSALENVQVRLQFERAAAGWLLARRPATDFLFAEAADRLGWKAREHSVGLQSDVAAVLRHLRNLQFWAAEQESTGVRARARKALMVSPRPAWLRLQMAVFQLDKAVRPLMAQIDTEHAGLASTLNAAAVEWWREYFSKPRLALPWLRVLLVLVPIAGYLGTVAGMGHPKPATEGLLGAAVALVLIAAILLGKLYLLDWPRHRHLQKYKTQVPAWQRLGWFPATLSVLLLSALLPDTPWSVAAVTAAGVICIVWVSTVTNGALPDGEDWLRIAGYWVLMNVPLTLAWWIIAQDKPGPSTPMLPALLAVLLIERIGRGALFAEYKYGIPVAARRVLPYAIAATAILALVASILLPREYPWLQINVAILTALVVIARTPALLLTAVQNKIRYYLLWIPAVVLFNMALDHRLAEDLGATRSVAIVGVWLMTGAVLGMAMVAFNQWAARGTGH